MIRLPSTSGSKQTRVRSRPPAADSTSHEVSIRRSLENRPVDSSSQQNDHWRPQPETTDELHSRPIPRPNQRRQTAVQHAFLGTIRRILRQMETHRTCHRPTPSNDTSASNTVCGTSAFSAAFRGEETLSQSHKDIMAQTGYKHRPGTPDRNKKVEIHYRSGGARAVLLRQGPEQTQVGT